MLEGLLKNVQSLSWVDWVVTITALIYVVGSARNKVWCWYWGMVSCGLWAYASYTYYQLYLDALLQLFYVGMAVWGIYQWRQGGTADALPISRLTWRHHIMYLGLGTAISLPFGYFFDTYTQAASTYWDAFTTIFAVLATWMLVRRQLDSWAYWVIIDLVYVGLYYSRGAYLFALLMVVYTLIAIWALQRWLGAFSEQKTGR